MATKVLRPAISVTATNTVQCVPAPEDAEGRVPGKATETATGDNKWQRYRLRKQRQWEASGEAFLYINCRFCGEAIKPSYSRGFCPRPKAPQDGKQKALSCRFCLPQTSQDAKQKALSCRKQKAFPCR